MTNNTESPNKESPEDRMVLDDIQRLREWLEKQPHLPQGIEDAELETFVRGTNGLEVAKKKLDLFFTLRGRAPQLFDFKHRDPLDPAFQEASKAIKMFFLPKPTLEGYRVLVMRIEKEFSTFLHHQKIVRTLMLIELAMVTWPNMKGIVFCYDMASAPANLLSRLSLTLAGVSFHWFQNAIPMKMKKGLIIKAPSFINIIVNKIAKPFLSSKLYDRIIVSTEGEEILKKYLPVEILPSDFGGAEESSEVLNEYWMKMLEKKRDWFKMTSEMVSDEKKRPPDSTATYGIEGTFRSLTFD